MKFSEYIQKQGDEFRKAGDGYDTLSYTSKLCIDHAIQRYVDEYAAKQQAIAFMNWTFTEGCQYTATDYDQWTEVGNHLDNKTTEELYQIFEQQNKDNGSISNR